MPTVSLAEAQTDLDALVAMARSGETVILTKDGQPIAQVVAFGGQSTPRPRQLGFLRDEIDIPDDFDEMGRDDIADLFSGHRS